MYWMHVHEHGPGLVDRRSRAPPTGSAGTRGWDVAEARGLVLQRVFLPPLDPARLLYPDLPHDSFGRVDVSELRAGDTETD